MCRGSRKERATKRHTRKRRTLRGSYNYGAHNAIRHILATTRRQMKNGLYTDRFINLAGKLTISIFLLSSSGPGLFLFLFMMEQSLLRRTYDAFAISPPYIFDSRRIRASYAGTRKLKFLPRRPIIIQRNDITIGETYNGHHVSLAIW